MAVAETSPLFCACRPDPQTPMPDDAVARARAAVPAVADGGAAPTERRPRIDDADDDDIFGAALRLEDTHLAEGRAQGIECVLRGCVVEKWWW